MAKQIINIGSSANDGTGSSLRAGGDLINDNFNEIYTALGDGSSISSAAFVTTTGTQTLTNKTLTAPKINEDVAVTSTATELNLLDGKAATNLALVGKIEGTNFTSSLLVGHATTGTLNAAVQNTGVGIGAMDAITTGDNNSAFGFDSGGALTGGQRNTYFGASSGEQNVSSNDNTGFGQKTLEESGVSGATSTGNSAFGMQALNKVTSGDYNLGLGWKAGDNLTTGSGNVIIGSVDATAVDSARTLKIAGYDGTTTTTWISGDSSGNLTFPANVTTSGNAIITGDLTVNGTTTTVSSTNTTVADNLLELNSGASSNANDTGIIMERGSTGDNAIFAWDESADKFIVGTTTATASDTGDLSIATGTLVANIEGNVTGNVTGNADTATALATGRTIGMTGDVVWTSASFDGSGNVTGTAAIQANTISSTELVSATTLLIVDSTGSTVKTIIGAGS
jgi:hypothetical protein